jgi:hypothetical protein
MFWWVAVCSDMCEVCLVVGVFYWEEFGSAMVFLVGDVSFMLHFGFCVLF